MPAHGPGWHFLSFAALTLVIVVVAAGWGPAAVDDLRHARYERQDVKRIEPARVQVTRMDPPVGARPCDVTQADLDAWGQVCWHQATDVRRAMADAELILQRVGGVVVGEPECVRDATGHVACLLYGDLKGWPFVLNAFRPALPGGGRSPEARVTGGLDVPLDHPKLFERNLPGGPFQIHDGWWGGIAPGPPPQPVLIPVPSSS